MKVLFWLATFAFVGLSHALNRDHSASNTEQARSPKFADYFNREPGDEKKPFGDIKSPYQDELNEADVHAVLGE